MEASRSRVRGRQRNAAAHAANSSSSSINEGIPVPPDAESLDTELGLVWERNEKILETELGAVGNEAFSSGQSAVRNSRVQSGHGLVIHPTAPPVEDIDLIIRDYKVQNDKILEQHALIQSKKEFMKERKEFERTQIVDLFSSILDILADKEASFLCKLDEKYKPKEDKLDELLSSIEEASENIKTETNVAESIKSGDSRFENELLDDLKPLLSDIKTGIREREAELNSVLADSDTQAVEINDDVLNNINELDYVKIQEPLDTDEDETSYVQITAQDTTNNVESSSHESNIEAAEHIYELDSNTENIGTTEIGNSETDLTTDNGDLENTVNLPSAPPQPEVEEEPPPPPYWQAIGLSGPQDMNAPVSPVSGPITPDLVPQFQETVASARRPNELVFYHNFLLKRQYDARAPKPVAVTWNSDRICVADRANSKLKFFSSSGGFCSEMYLGGCEIYDMAFIETHANEHRYVVTIPGAKTLMFIALSEGRPPRMLYKIKMNRKYTCIAKGPSGNTFVGADARPNSGDPRIDILNIQGEVLRTFNRSAYSNFSYPRCIAVFKQAIAVADWKQNCIVVLHEDGRTIAKYGGTEHFPLKEPTSLTFDQFGNIMIVDGKTGSIHVVDLQGRPVEVIKCPRGQSVPKHIAFEASSRRLAIVRQLGDIAVYDFKGGYISNSYNETFGVNSMFQSNYPEALPLVEGMLPSTIANIASPRQRQASMINRSNMFHL